MSSITDIIIEKALKLLEENPDGLRYSELVRRIVAENTKINTNTARGVLWNIDQNQPSYVYKPSRGLFRHLKFKQLENSPFPQTTDESQSSSSRIKEEDFYQPFADWLQNDLEECTHAIPLGGNRFKDKWGTPDVIGKMESKKSDIIQAPIEIISAEIKPDVNALITAFGQACAYCIFSHKTYLVVATNSPQDELSRLDSLCQAFGIGLVLFDSSSPNEPNFQIRVRAIKRDPDLFYTNKYIKYIEGDLFK